MAVQRGTLYLVAVPIGNPDDLGLRARRLLGSVAVVAAEDTRHYATLARHHDLPPRAVSYHEHNEASRTRELIARLDAGAQQPPCVFQVFLDEHVERGGRDEGRWQPGKILDPRW